MQPGKSKQHPSLKIKVEHIATSDAELRLRRVLDLLLHKSLKTHEPPRQSPAKDTLTRGPEEGLLDE